MAQWRWSIVGLVVAGFVAALCAAALVFLVRSESRNKKPVVIPDITYVCAAKALPAMTRLESESLATRTVTAKQAPEAYISNSAQVLGKVLAIPLVEGQPLTQSCFVPNGSSQQMAANIPSGKRAVTLSLPGDSSMKGLLYPGSLVDVVASFDVPADKMPGGRAQVSKVMVQNVEVLAVEEKTVFTPPEAPANSGGIGGILGNAPAPMQRQEHQLELVTLLVDPTQAQALRLAMQHGTVSLAMRNPTDQTVPEAKVTLIGDLLGPIGSEPTTQTTSMPAVSPVFMSEPGAKAEPSAMKTGEMPGAKVEPPPEKPHWDVTILRGGVSETRSFDLPPIKSRSTGK